MSVLYLRLKRLCPSLSANFVTDALFSFYFSLLLKKDFLLISCLAKRGEKNNRTCAFSKEEKRTIERARILKAL